MVLIEGTVFVLAIVTYFYMREHSYERAPNRPPPGLLFGTLNTLVLLASTIPNQWTKHVADREDLRGVRIGMVVCIAFAAVFLVLRVFEFGALNTSWNDSA